MNNKNQSCNCSEYQPIEATSFPQASIPARLDELAQKIQELISISRELCSRLEPVMLSVREEEKEVPKQENSVSSDCLIARDIYNKTDAVRTANYILSDILARLQV